MDWFQVCVVSAFVCTLVVATPPPGYVKKPDTDQHPPKYEFGYDIPDGTGGSQGHLESREGEYALGKYYVRLPSNEQKVDYFADDWGYHPLVEYKTSSASSSMSAQIALGEKAVAALSRQYGVEPPLEILKTKVAQAATTRDGPQISVHGSSGIIPGPSVEPVHNSLESESYLSTTTSLPILQASTTPNSLSYDNTPTAYFEQESSTTQISGGSHVPQIISTSTELPVGTYSSLEHGTTVSTSGNRGAQNQNSFYNAASLQFSDNNRKENFPKIFGQGESKAQEEFEVQKQSLAYQSPYTESASYSSSGSSLLKELSSNENGNYEIQSGPGDSSAQQVNSQLADSSSVTESLQDHEVTSYLADTNAAIDVTSQGLSRKLSETPLFSPNTRISAVFVSEGENQYEDNEVQNHNKQNYISSTTPRPLKTVLKPIVVSDSERTATPLSLFSAHRLFPTEGHRSRKIGKLYHREGRLKGSGGYSTSSPTSVKANTPSSDDSYYSTPTSTTESVLVTPKLESSALTSSGNFLAPIQAGLSISTHNHPEYCDDNSDSKHGYIPSSGPDIEKQEIREEAVYKTTVDIQKSIPFEIHPNEDDYQHSHEESHAPGQEYSQSIKEDYNNNKVVGYNENTNSDYNHGSSEEYSEHFGKGTQQEDQSRPYGEHYQDNSVEYANTHLRTSESFNHGPNYNVQNGPSNQIHPDSESKTIPSGYGADTNTIQYNRNNFIQQVLYAYHRMANNNQHIPDGTEYPTYQVPTQPLIVPNRLYYVYLQRYNPYVNRYGGQDQLYSNYRPTAPASSQVLSGYHDNGSQNSHENFLPRGPKAYTQGYEGNNQYNLNGDLGYASVVNHDEDKHYEPSNGDINVNSQIGNGNIEKGQSHDAHFSSQGSYQGASVDLNNNYNQGITSASQDDNSHGDNKEQQSINISQNPEGSKFTETAGNDVDQSSSVFNKALPHYYERTKLVEAERQVPIQYPTPLELTKPIDKPIPVGYTKIISVEKPLAVPHPVPYAVTKLVPLDRPVAYPQPVPLPYPIPHPVGIPVSHLVPYPVPLPVKDYRPVYIYRKSSPGRLFHREPHHVKHVHFRPSQPVFTSQYPPQTYQVTGYLHGPHAQTRGHGRKLCIEYGGFKPPLVPSTPVEDEEKSSYGPAKKEKHST